CIFRRREPVVLQAQVAFLQGERRGQENLKKDLVRRIKMLEFVLKQERAKHHRLKFGTELNQGEMDPPSYDSGEFCYENVSATSCSTNSTENVWIWCSSSHVLKGETEPTRD
uniref:Striatin N-terminal domain-containing protein n=1 Tax=Oryzias sinensis TaxID=183150 RepID=A0A8C8DSF2_9TELE